MGGAVVDVSAKVPAFESALKMELEMLVQCAVSHGKALPSHLAHYGVC